MKIKKEYIILASIIIILSIYLLKQQKSNMHYSLPELKKIDKKDISKLIIKKADLKITLTKKNNKWVIMPQNFKANNDLADKIAEEISSLTITDLVSESKNDALYDLNKEKKIVVEAYKGNEALRKIDLGKTASSYRHTFVRIEKDDRVFHAQGNLTNTFNKTVSDLRDKTVLAFKNEEITEISLTKGDKKISIKKKTEEKEGSLTKWATDKGKSANEQDIEEIIKTLSNFACDGFIEDKAKNDFKNPSFTIVLKGTKEYSISLFEKVENKYSAISSESEFPFNVSEWSAKRFTEKSEVLLLL